jgi:hypothetical protein
MGHAQSGQLLQVSPKLGWHVPLPQLGTQAHPVQVVPAAQPQSGQQQFSPGSQIPFGQVDGQRPQSCGQFEQVSPPGMSQLPLGHVAQHFDGQVLQVSPSWGWQGPGVQITGSHRQLQQTVPLPSRQSLLQ